ncbi:hypothetical protein DFH06DRAFT_756454 [Mycena polygramma]|nr:hypothetical protein DFH06DRAFT_756454 [Mycena polygramma]
MSSTPLDHALHYATLAAATLKDIADTTGMPILRMPAALTLTIAKLVEGTRANKIVTTQMAQNIHQTLCSVIGLYSATHKDGVLSPVVLYNISQFTDTLQRIVGILTSRQSMGRFKQLLKQNENASQLQACRAELHHLTCAFRDQCIRANLTSIARMEMETTEMHDELMSLLATFLDLTVSDTSSLSTSLSAMGDSMVSINLLPAYPKICEGRASELNHIVGILQQDSPRVAVLGAGGMGKTTVAVAALHHSDIEARYSTRYFISCQTLTSDAEILSAIASHIGIDRASSLKRVVQCLKCNSTTLLVLDNFETPWEFPGARRKVEELLAHLADVANLAILVTMRGAERPGNIQWSHPFLPPLSPITDSAALDTFFAIADDYHEKDTVSALLELTGNLPLAITLIASAVACEGCEATLARYKLEKTRLFDGYDKRSSLELSIILSLSSPRLTPNARELLSLLSILPDGLSEAELVQCKVPIDNILSGKAALLRTSLAFVDGGRLQLLVPIREYIFSSSPPPNRLKEPLRHYLHQILEVWSYFENVQPSPSILSQTVNNLGNIQGLLLDSLQTDASDVTVCKSVFYLHDFTWQTNRPAPSLIFLAIKQLEAWQNHPAYGHFLTSIVQRSSNFPMLDINSHITDGNRYFQSASAVEQARWYCAVSGHYKLHENNLAKGIEYSLLALDLVDGMNRPTNIGCQSCVSLADMLTSAENPLKARKYALRGYVCARQLGYAIGEAISLSLLGRCAMALGDLKNAKKYMQSGLAHFIGSGMQGSHRHVKAQSFLAELHLLKTEYAESRSVLQASMAGFNPRHPPTLHTVFTDLNVASIDIVTGVDLDVVAQTLENIRKQLNGFAAPICPLFYDMILGELKLYQGELGKAKELFQRSYRGLVGAANDGSVYCLEQLADHSWGMCDAQDSLHWSVTLLAFGRRIKDKLAQIHALRCLGKVFLAHEDHYTASSLFHLALEEFTFMDVHRWRADCMVHVARIHESHGEIQKSIELWMSAIPLFKRSSQRTDAMLLEAKLPAVDFNSSDDIPREP